jgi:hypothetical protein
VIPKLNPDFSDITQKKKTGVYPVLTLLSGVAAIE